MKASWLFFAVLLAVPTVFALDFFINSEKRAERKALQTEKLVKYHYLCSGDKQGSRREVSICASNCACAVMCTIERKNHWEKEIKRTYSLPAQALPEIEALFRRHKMHEWSPSELKKEFVADGATESFDFYFGDTAVRISSQFFPAKYRAPIAELKALIEKYRAADAESVENKERDATETANRNI